jgi:uncharacterized protein (DUF2141 family)
MKALALAAALLALGASSAGAAELRVTVQNIRSDRGEIRLAVYANPAEWPDKAPSARERVLKAQRSGVTFVFDLPPGTYAVNCFHDENSNGKFDTNFVGYPLEGYCFSNDAHPFLSAPSFDAVRFAVPPAGAAIVVHMVY